MPRLIQCPSCRRHVLASEPDCPFCGQPGLTTGGRSGAASALLLGLCLIGSASCDSGKDTKAEPEPASTAAPADDGDERAVETPTPAEPEAAETGADTTGGGETGGGETGGGETGAETAGGSSEGTDAGAAADPVPDRPSADVPRKTKYGAPRPKKKYGAPSPVNDEGPF